MYSWEFELYSQGSSSADREALREMMVQMFEQLDRYLSHHLDSTHNFDDDTFELIASVFQRLSEIISIIPQIQSIENRMNLIRAFTHYLQTRSSMNLDEEIQENADSQLWHKNPFLKPSGY